VKLEGRGVGKGREFYIQGIVIEVNRKDRRRGEMEEGRGVIMVCPSTMYFPGREQDFFFNLPFFAICNAHFLRGLDLIAN